MENQIDVSAAVRTTHDALERKFGDAFSMNVAKVRDALGAFEALEAVAPFVLNLKFKPSILIQDFKFQISKLYANSKTLN